MGSRRRAGKYPQWLEQLNDSSHYLWKQNNILLRMEVRATARKGIHLLTIRSWATGDGRPLNELASVSEEYPSAYDESFDSAVFRLTNLAVLRTEEAHARWMAQARML